MEVSELRKRASGLFEPIAARLRAQRLIGGPIAIAPLLVALIAPVLGAIKIAVGIMRDKPVGWLVLFCILAAIVAVRRFGQRPQRSRRGETVLARLRQEHAGVQQGWADGGGRSYPVALAIALFGLGVLASSALAQLADGLQPSSSSDGGGGGGDGGGDGGGGCGGGCGGCGG
jgi:uncharacterized protein (TIGR04222 family)